MIKIIFSDVDGTIFHPRKHLVSEKSYEAISKMKNNGCKLILNSSRTYEEMQLLPKKLLDLADGLIACSGSLIETDDLSRTFKIENAPEIIALLDELGINYRYTTADKLSYLNKSDSYIEGIYREIYDYKPKIKKYEDEELVHIHYFPENNDPEFERKYAEVFRDCSFIHTSRSHECFNRNTDKGKAALYLSNRYGSDETYAIGDGNSDLAMILVMKYGIAMGNGKDKLKENADYISETIENEGFYLAMEYYGLTGGENV